VRHAIGYVAQDSGVDWEATGRENMLLQGRIHGMAGASLRKRVEELLELTGLTGAADRVARGYSGGMKRRLDIAIGLVHKPSVLFLDEPTTGLDPEARAAMWVEVERLARQENLTILLTTHYLEEADRLAERVAIVSRGRIVVEGTPEDLKAGLRGESVSVELRESDGRLGEAVQVVQALDGAVDRHVVDRFLAAPASRLAIVLSQVARAGFTAVLQALILLLVGLALGVRVHGGLLGWLVVCAASALLATVFSGFSNGVALLLRRQPSMIAAANFVGLPLMFLSSILLATALMPGWISAISRFNPVNWGVEAARNAVVTGGHWGPTGAFLLYLLAATAVTSAFATWTFRAYQRSI
jgi:ABC transporter DrrB family efflux protein